MGSGLLALYYALVTTLDLALFITDILEYRRGEREPHLLNIFKTIWWFVLFVYFANELRKVLQ